MRGEPWRRTPRRRTGFAPSRHTCAASMGDRAAWCDTPRATPCGRRAARPRPLQRSVRKVGLAHVSGCNPLQTACRIVKKAQIPPKDGVQKSSWATEGSAEVSSRAGMPSGWPAYHAGGDASARGLRLAAEWRASPAFGSRARLRRACRRASRGIRGGRKRTPRAAGWCRRLGSLAHLSGFGSRAEWQWRSVAISD